MAKDSPEVSIVLPCRNESETLGHCISSIREVVEANGIDAEIIVSDSSTDDSPKIAAESGARMVKHDLEGYGIACLEGFRASRGRYVFLADADGSYDFKEIPCFVEHLRRGCDLVMGDRFKGSMEDGAMSWHHRYVGNPLLTFLFNVLHGSGVHDVHCGMRAITRDALNKLDLRTSGMEFASEMVLAARKKKLRVKEVPINYYKRGGKSKMRSFADGWRHLKFMLAGR
ncbi:MAG: glycosyltransferase family 2 protein [Candidatus Altiarchaeota archaeon]|nr:glycosyltransferase family 2 protein [Candidatus Altiarchaeota archaeon]